MGQASRKSTIDAWITKSDRVTFNRYEIDLTCIDGKLALSDFLSGLDGLPWIDNAIVNFHLIIVDNKAILYLQALNI